MQTFSYVPTGVCSTRYDFVVDETNNTIIDVKAVAGCPGNLAGISNLLKGMKIEEVIERLEGVKCGFKPTSCPEQISFALRDYLAGKLQ